jgi:hypothetical protein
MSILFHLLAILLLGNLGVFFIASWCMILSDAWQAYKRRRN